MNRRRLDLGLSLFFAVTILYGFLFSLPEGLGLPVASDSSWPPLRSLHGWAVAQEPAHLDPPPVLIASSLFDGLFYFSTTFLGPTPPPSLGVYLPFNLPWLIAPALLGWRMRGAEPFATSHAAK